MYRMRAYSLSKRDGEVNIIARIQLTGHFTTVLQFGSNHCIRRKQNTNGARQMVSTIDDNKLWHV